MLWNNALGWLSQASPTCACRQVTLQQFATLRRSVTSSRNHRCCGIQLWWSIPGNRYLKQHMTHSYGLSKVFQKDKSHIGNLANCKGKWVTKSSFSDGYEANPGRWPRLPCSTVGAACHAAGSGCSGWAMPGNDSANACRTMVYTLRRGIGLFVCQRPELFLKYPELLLKYSELFVQYSELFPKYPLLLLRYPEQFRKYPKLVLKHSKHIQKIVQNHSKIPPKNTHSYFQTSSSHFGSNVGPFTWWG